MALAQSLHMSSTWVQALAAGRKRRAEGHPQTHTQCKPQITPLSILDDEQFLEDYFNYHSTLPAETNSTAASQKLNSITEKVLPDVPFPLFLDFDFDAEWFGPNPSQLYVTMSTRLAFDLIKETIELFGTLIMNAFSLADRPHHVSAMRAFYKCHIHFPDVFVTSDMAAALVKEAARILAERHEDHASNIIKALDMSVYGTGLRILGSHKGELGKAKRMQIENEHHQQFLHGHYYSQQYLVAEFDYENETVTPIPLTLDALKRLSIHRQGTVLPVNASCTFMVQELAKKQRNKRKHATYLQHQHTQGEPVNLVAELGDDAGWEDVARAFVSQALREAQMDPTVLRVRKYANTGFIEVTLSPRECPMKKAAHKRTEERNGAANYVLVGLTHSFLRCWKCEGSIQLEDTPERLGRMMDVPAQRRDYNLFASLHDNTHELVTNVLFDAMKETYSVAAVSDHKYHWYYFDTERHRWIQYEKVMTAIMKDKGPIQNMWTSLVKELKREMVPAEGRGEANGQVDIYETILLRKLIRNLQNVGFIKNSIMALLARKIDWHWRAKTPSCTPFMDLLNSQSNLVGFTNGVYDTKTLSFRPGRPDDFISKSTGVAYVPWADQPADLREGLLNFLRQVQSVPEELDFMLWALASSLRGDARVSQAFYFWIGMGANGKSTLIRVINKAMGDYACETPVTLFTRERPSSEKPCPELVATRGCLFASAPEPGLTDTFVMSTIKGVAGSDKQTARRLNENMQSWYGTATFHCSMNGIPVITSRDEDYGTWRRLIVIKFDSRFVPNPSGPREFKKLESMDFEAQLESWGGPLASLLVNYIERKERVPLPPAFAKATQDLKLKNDIIGKFVAHSVTVDDSTFCEVMEAFSAFNTFKRMANVKGRPVTEDQFTLYMSTNVAPLRTRLNAGKEENGWGVVIKVCPGGERSFF